MIYIETPISEKPDKYDYSSNTQVTTICAKELRGEAGCKELCDECKGNTLATTPLSSNSKQVNDSKT